MMMMIKRDTLYPNKAYVEPPLFGNYKRQGQHGLMKDKLHKLTTGVVADRGNLTTLPGQCGKSKKAPVLWQNLVPPGTSVCFEYGKPPPPQNTFLSSLKRELKKKGERRSLRLNQLGKTIEPSDGSYKQKFAPPKPPPPLPCTPGMNNDKYYYNMMWDPHVARGGTYLQFEEAQRKKCSELDLNRSIQFRNFRRKRCEPLKRVCKESKKERKLTKEPLCYSKFADFLTETINVEHKEEGTDMHTEFARSGVHEPKKMPCYSVGVPQEMQTDFDDCREETIDWAATAMNEKIEEQALLEMTEEADLEVIRGQRQRFETALLYKRWQLAKEREWQAWLTQWYHIRSQDILRENAELQEIDEVLGLLGFAKNAISCLWCRTNETMKVDGYIDKKSNRSFEELEVIEKIFNLDEEVTTKYRKGGSAAKILDSSIVRAVVHRFDRHIHDDYGKPHGIWLSRRKKPAPSMYDQDLAKYLDKIYIRRHGIHDGGGGGRRKVSSDLSIADDFDPRTFEKKKSELDIADGSFRPKRQTTAQRKTAFDPSHIQKMISPTKLGRKTMGESSNAVRDDSFDADADDGEVKGMDVIFKRKSSWSTLEKRDEKRGAKPDK